jgi:hypothetical protein
VTPMDIRHCLLLAAMSLLAPALRAAEPPADFTAAKAAADADEASLDAAAKAAALEQQRAFLDARVADCASNDAKADLSDFVVVMRLDADGTVAQTWRRGDSPLALCVERSARGKLLFVPPRSPFHSSLEIGFVP